MNFIQAVILGFVQGLTELLPISSSGHLILIPHIFNWPDQGLAFDAVMHLATALVIIFALRAEIKSILLTLFSGRTETSYISSSRLWLVVAAAVVPAGIVGWFFSELIEDSLRQVQIVALSLIIWALVLAWAEYYNSKFKNLFSLEQINVRQSLGVGLAQILAFIPGTSRSGITITAGLFGGLDKSTAVKFSFLAGLPLILAAGIYKLFSLWQLGLTGFDWQFLLIGFFSAMFSSWLAIKCLFWLAKRGSFKIFVIYRLILGLLLLWLL